MLFGPDDLWESNKDIIKHISFLSVGFSRMYLCFYWIGNLYNVWVKI